MSPFTSLKEFQIELLKIFLTYFNNMFFLYPTHCKLCGETSLIESIIEVTKLANIGFRLLVWKWTPWLHLFLLYSIQYVDINSNSGTLQAQWRPLFWDWVRSGRWWRFLAKPPEGIVSLLRALLRCGGGDAQVHTLASLRHSHWVRWRATARGCYGCTLGKV